MSAAATGPRRARVLRALGVTPWVRRRMPEPSPATAETAGQATEVACAVLLPAGCDARALDLLGRAFLAFGEPLARAPRIAVREGRPAAGVPEARTFLVFGQAQAHALGRELSAAAMNRAQIVLAEEPARVLAGGAGKRGLWVALRQLRRALAAGG